MLLDEYKDVLYKYVVHSSGRETFGLNDDAEITIMRDRLRELRGYEPLVKDEVYRFTSLIYAISIIIIIILSYILFHAYYMNSHRASTNMIVALLLLIVGTIMYVWINGLYIS